MRELILAAKIMNPLVVSGCNVSEVSTSLSEQFCKHYETVSLPVW